MNVTKNFVGIFGTQREVGLYLTDAPVGMRIQPGAFVSKDGQYRRASHKTHARIVSIEHPEACRGLVSVGDDVQRLNGTDVEQLDFNDPATHIKFRSRPIVIDVYLKLVQNADGSEGCGVTFKRDVNSPPLYLP
jgi:hypothetical protein